MFKKISTLLLSSSLLFLSALFVPTSASAYNLLGGKYGVTTIGFNYQGTSATYNLATATGISAWKNANVDVSFESHSAGETNTILFYNDSYGANIGWNAQCANKPVHTSGTYTKSIIDFNTSTMDSMSNAQRQGVSAHEIGHALGLDHVSDKYQIMCTWGDGRVATSPGSDDIKGVNYLY
ncbi:matrixin family metalloprotease [Paenibacillus sediminis]|uniref:Peptidase M10 metallopeptidase domain-containing protein n=1 Tax=Paenibacillus sediminis TaxID=664909 RepID=A0ABS4H0F5_9BACL|nr:matrixin family metalloprotease [Paenibacillus sediminis]MBP1936018.1 hypothetical protein [Paenibacillus sediminis]